MRILTYGLSCLPAAVEALMTGGWAVLQTQRLPDALRLLETAAPSLLILGSPRSCGERALIAAARSASIPCWTTARRAIAPRGASERRLGETHPPRLAASWPAGYM